MSALNPAPKAAPRLVVIDGLRLVAALMVALFHFTGYDNGVRDAWGAGPAEQFPGLYRATSFGWLGVELFFMISGFVICMSSWGRTPGAFFRSRIIRLFPAYWAAVLITTAVLFAFPTVRHHLQADDVVLNLSMLNLPLNIRPVDAVYWTLWAEARFYLLFLVLVWRGLTLRRTLIFGYAWLIASVLSVNSDMPRLKTILQPEYAPFFVAGIAFYLIHRFGPDITLWGLVGASFLLAQHDTWKRVLHYGPDKLGRPLSATVGVLLVALFFVALTAIALGWTSRVQWRWLTTAGLLTYPFYLLHEYVGWTLIYALRDLAPRYVILVAVLLLMLLAAWLLHRLVEKPVARLLKEKLTAAGVGGVRPERSAHPTAVPR
ncbi:acyltransferase family protein [Micromonosporaceae bacterium Da 78-11]